jgi:CMP/dCMP kinase
MIIAIDGPTAAGKGTLARQLADHFDFAYLDTGSIYRAVASLVLEAQVDVSNQDDVTALAQKLSAGDLQRTDLRAEDVGQLASKIAVYPDVRQALLDFQRSFAESPPAQAKGAVLDGRDIGTVICPNADLKLYITASDEVRASRRHKELIDKGVTAIYAEILADLKVRDQRDQSRSAAPSRPAEDAYILDTSTMSAEAVLDKALSLVAGL